MFSKYETFFKFYFLKIWRGTSKLLYHFHYYLLEIDRGVIVSNALVCIYVYDMLSTE